MMDDSDAALDFAGFLPIDPRLPTFQRWDDMGRKAGLKGMLTLNSKLTTGFMDCFVPRNDAKRVNDAKRQLNN